MSQVVHQAGRAYPDFSSMKRQGVFLLPLDGMLVHRRVAPSIKFVGTHLNTCVERGIMRVKCLVQEHNSTRMSQPGLKPGPLARELSALTMRSPYLPLHPGVHLYKWVLSNLMLGVTLGWTNIPSKGRRNTPSWFVLQKLQISPGLMGHWFICRLHLRLVRFCLVPVAFNAVKPFKQKMDS